MPHFFIKSETIDNNIVKITDNELLTHLVKALRVKVGEELLFFDENKTRYETVVETASKSELKAKIVKSEQSKRYLNNEIYLATSIIKQESLFELISGVTQLGIKGLFPLYTDNTSVSKAQIKDKTQKWQKISDESVKQCERADFMKIYPTTTLKDFDYSTFDKIIVFSEIEQTLTLKKALKNIKTLGKILVIVGPEGGFSKDEFEFFKQKKFIQVKISDLILKAQTACISGLSNLIYELNE